MLRWIHLRTTALAAALLAIAPPAAAQSSDQKGAAAQLLFDEAMKLIQSGHAAEACPKLVASNKLDPALGTQYRLAECYAKIGKTATAWALYLEVADLAKAAGRPDREDQARERAAALEPKLSKLAVVVAPSLAGLAGLRVERDGIPLDKTTWGVPLPVDPGEHVVQATAPGKKPWLGRHSVAEGGASADILVPLLEDGPAPAAPEAPAPAAAERRSIVPAVALGGAAVVLAGVGVGLFVTGKAEASDAGSLAKTISRSNRRCSTTVNTDPDCVRLVDGLHSADKLHDAAVGVFIGAGVAGAAAVTWLLLPQSAAKRAPAGFTATPIAGASQGGLLISGVF
jgi:hypothetical protein